MANTYKYNQKRVPNLIRETGSGTINSACYSLSVANVGGADGVFLGVIIKDGETLSFNAGGDNDFYPSGSFNYDGTGTELVIIYNTAD